MAKINDSDLEEISDSDLEDIPTPDAAPQKFNVRTHPLHRFGSAAMRGGLGLAQLAAHAIPGDTSANLDKWIANEDSLNAEANKNATKIPLLGVGIPEAAGYIADPLNMLMASKLAKPIINSNAINPLKKFMETRAVNKHLSDIETGRISDTIGNFIDMPTVSNSPFSKVAKGVAAGATMGFGNGLIAPTVKKDYGPREDGTPKGSGYFGELPMTDGSNNVATEISIGVNIDGKETLIPALVPGLSESQKAHLLNGGKPTSDIIDVAVKHAKQRMSDGQSPFSDTNILHERMDAANKGFALGGALPIVATGAGKLVNGFGDLLSQITGGGVGIKESYQAGLKGGEAQKVYKKFSKQDSSLTSVIPELNSIIPVLKNEKNIDYKHAMDDFVEHNELKPIDNVNNSIIGKANSLDVEIGKYKGRDTSPELTAAKNELHNLIMDWNNRDPMLFHSAPGLDHLKKEVGRLGDKLTKSNHDPEIKAIYSQMGDYISKVINHEDPNYARFMKPYADSIKRIKEVEDSLLSDNTEVGIRKFSRALSSPFKRELLDEFDKRNMGELPSVLAGYNTKRWMPGSIFNTGNTTIAGMSLAGLAQGHPEALLMLSAISPKFASGIANKIGTTKRAITRPGKKIATDPLNYNLLKEGSNKKDK